MTKYIFVTGGVVSSLGKGIAAASLGRLLKDRGLKVFMQKFDPYINIDPGTMSPYQHGEVFVTDDGGETDLDLGHYERFIDVNLTKSANITMGKVYSSVIEKERRGDYLGATIQVIPHITNEIKAKLIDASKESDADIIITEIGGTVGDIESLPFLEAIRQARIDFGYENTLYIHNTLVPYLKAADELKTKPTQHSVKELSSLGIQPDVIILRSEIPIKEEFMAKISSFCNVPQNAVIAAIDAPNLYRVALSLHEQNLDSIVLKHFNIDAPTADLSQWKELTKRVESLDGSVSVAIVGKYVALHDAYLSVVESLKHAGYFYGKNINIVWVNSEHLNKENIIKELQGVDAILVPGGFGNRGIEGKILACQYARENNIPYLGICLGMQIATIEFAQHVALLKGANSTEFDTDTPYPLIDFLPDQYENIAMGGTLRLGLFDCILQEGSHAYQAYQSKLIKERHRHRYEFNNKYKAALEKAGLIFSGINPQTNLVEIIELKDHCFFVATQFHPEFLSRPLRPHPLFKGLIAAAMK